MPDYNSILRRSIEGVPDHTTDMRRAIYERARATIARQLASVDPPIPAEQIEIQHQKLELAIAEIEAEYAFVDFDPAEFEAEIGLHEPPEAESDEPEEYVEDEIEADNRSEPVYDQREASIDFGTPGGGYAASGPPVDIRPSRAPLLIVLGLLLLAGIGAGVLGYRHQDQVMAFVERMTAPGDEASDPQGPIGISEIAEGADDGNRPVATAPAESEAVVAKSEERLGTVGAVDGVDDLRGSEPGKTIQPQTNGVTAGLPAAGLDSQPVEIVTDDNSLSLPPTGLDVTQPEPVVTGAAGSTDNVAGSDTVGIVSQRAIFYTQGDDENPGQASQGSVAWSRVDQPDGLPAIQARIALADPKIEVVITIKKNTDEGLPASHMIEVSFDGVANISAAAIERIPALVMKPSEQARGEPLVGAGVPVTDSIFWIALSDEAEQVTSNMASLRDGTWFDMPLLFKDKQRALITFEKGGPGEMLFKEVLAAWEAG